MKVLQIIGAILIAAGLYVLVKGASYPSDKSLFKVGDVEAKIEQHHEVPPWVGGVAIAAGVVLVVVGIGNLGRALVNSTNFTFNACELAFKYLYGRTEYACEGPVFDKCMSAFQGDGMMQSAIESIAMDPSYCQ